MFCPQKVYKAPPNSGQVVLGRTLPSLLDEACDRYSNPQALNDWSRKGWRSLSTQEFRKTSEHLALGLLDLGFKKGDRIGILMENNINFCLADMGCLMAGIVNVPIYLTETHQQITFILNHTEARGVIVANLKVLEKVAPILVQCQQLEAIIIADVTTNYRTKIVRIWYSLPLLTSPSSQEGVSVPSSPTERKLKRVHFFSLAEIQQFGKEKFGEETRQQLRKRITPEDLATIIYTAGITGKSEGAMLTHESIAADILASFGGISALKKGKREIALSFLPLTHVFARAFLYGHLHYGHSLYFTTAKRVVKHLREIQPSIFITVPRLLEKVYSKTLERGRQLTGLTKLTFNWALNLAQQYELGQKYNFLYNLQLKLANRLVFSQWRKAIGGNVKYLISGGAALQGEIANVFSAAGIPILQGYGLTETSSVLSCNRGKYNRADTVGVPIAGVEMAIAEDGEILVKAPYVMKGYYKNPQGTRQAIDEAGWFHTGDIGEFTPEGFLRITDQKKNLFKLSIGKYVMLEPLENTLKKSPLVKQAVAIGAHRKFCGMLILPNFKNLCIRAQTLGLETPPVALLRHPQMLSLYQSLVKQANRGLPDWSTVKHFQLITTPLTVANGMLTADLRVNRPKVREVFAAQIDCMYAEGEKTKQCQLLKIIPVPSSELGVGSSQLGVQSS